MSNLQYPDIPVGLAIALSMDMDAMNYFSSVTQEERQRIIEHTHQIGSKEEMQEYVQSLAGGRIV